MKTILITGAARGIGFELAQRAIARGDVVFAMVRKEADKAKFQNFANAHPVLMDVADSDSVERAFVEVDRLLAGKPLDAVINSAAVAPNGAVEIMPIAEFEMTINTNLMGSLRVLKASIPRVRGHGGRIILITSLWGVASGPMLSAYCASKHAIESVADITRRETSGMDMHIVIVEPGIIRTDMYLTQGPDMKKIIDGLSPDHQSLYGNLYHRYLKLVGGPEGKGSPKAGISVEQCAAGIERAVFDDTPRTRYRVGADSKIVCLLAWLLPDRVMDWVLSQSLSNKPL